MHEKNVMNRREFCTAAAAGLVAMGALASPATGQAREAAGRVHRADPALIRKVLDGMESTIGRYWSVPRKDGEFLSLMVKATRATRILEVGTSQGYSAIWMGLGLQETGGRLTTIEVDPGRHALAQRNVREAGLAGQFLLIRGDAHTEIPGLRGPFDFVFFDADKDGQMDYFQKLHPAKLAPGAIIVVHNAVSAAGDLKEYTEMIRRHPEYDTVTVSTTMDDGMCLSYRRRAA